MGCKWCEKSLCETCAKINNCFHQDRAGERTTFCAEYKSNGKSASSEVHREGRLDMKNEIVAMLEKMLDKERTVGSKQHDKYELLQIIKKMEA